MPKLSNHAENDCEFYCACADGDIDCVQKLLKKWGNKYVNSDYGVNYNPHESPIYAACSLYGKKRKFLIKLLVDNGARLIKEIMYEVVFGDDVEFLTFLEELGFVPDLSVAASAVCITSHYSDCYYVIKYLAKKYPTEFFKHKDLVDQLEYIKRPLGKLRPRQL